jgi:hypothetical protein
MGSVEWYDKDKGIAIWKFAEGDTMDDIMANFQLFTDMVGNAGHKTYSVIDLLEYRSMPRNAMSYYPEMARLAPVGDRRSEVIAIVTQRTLINMSTEIFSKVYPDFKNRFVHYPTIQDALDYIYARIRETAA